MTVFWLAETNHWGGHLALIELGLALAVGVFYLNIMLKGQSLLISLLIAASQQGYISCCDPL
jgi:hypothetical protein